MTATAQTSVRPHLVHYLVQLFLFCFHIFYEFILLQTCTPTHHAAKMLRAQSLRTIQRISWIVLKLLNHVDLLRFPLVPLLLAVVCCSSVKEVYVTHARNGRGRWSGVVCTDVKADPVVLLVFLAMLSGDE